MIKRTTLFNGLLGTFGALLVIAGALYMYAAHIEEPYLYYQNLPFPGDSPIVAGEPVSLSVERCNRSSTVKRYGTTHTLTDVESRQTVLLPNVEVSIEPGCHRSISKINIVPVDTKTGRYIVSGVATVDGAFSTHRIAWYSEPFDVIAAPPAARGATGAAGPAGAKGATGAAGRQGIDGPPGATGAQGAKGSFWSK